MGIIVVVVALLTTQMAPSQAWMRATLADRLMGRYVCFVHPLFVVSFSTPLFRVTCPRPYLGLLIYVVCRPSFPPNWNLIAVVCPLASV